MKIYGDCRSGNCYKIKLTLSLLGINDYQWVEVDILKGETQTDAFLAINPIGAIPVAQFDELGKRQYLYESNAIINYLARGSGLIPRDEFLNAKMLEWQFFEQYSHEPYIAVARYINQYLGLPAEKKAEYESKQKPGHRALKRMEKQLNTMPYLVGENLTTADISLYAYTHVADEGGFDLSPYPALLDWLARIQKQSGYIEMG